MRQGLIAIAVLVSAAAPASAATRTWQVGDASRLRVDAAFDVRVRTGVPAGVRATGPQDAIDRVVVDQNGDTLAIRAAPGAWNDWPGRDRTPVIVEIGLRSLTAATLAGSGDLAIDRLRGDGAELSVAGSGDLTVGAIDVSLLKLKAAGSGDIVASGRAKAVEAVVVGSGDIRGEGLMAGDVRSSVVGSGDATLGAEHSATVTLDGSGDVRILGRATCTVRRRGAGDVSCAGRTVEAGGD